MLNIIPGIEQLLLQCITWSYILAKKEGMKKDIRLFETECCSDS